MAEPELPADRNPVVNTLRHIAQTADTAIVENAAQHADHERTQLDRQHRRLRWLGLLLMLLILGEAAWYLVIYVENGTVVGRVQDMQGRPITGAIVELENSEIRTETDGEGRFVLLGLRSGNHWVLIQLSGVSGAAVPVITKGRLQVDAGVVTLYQR